MTPTEVHQTLDDNGWLDAAHGPGVYALRVAVFDTAAVIEDATKSETSV